MAIVQSLAVVFYAGQAFVTCDRNSITGDLQLYCETSPITTFSGLTPIATIDEDSWHYLYDEAAAVVNLNDGFIVPTDGVGGTRQLASDEALAVIHPSSSASRYYAIGHAGDSTVTSGVNSLSSPIVETALPYVERSGVLINDQVADGGFDGHYVFLFEDHATWDSRDGYPGTRFAIVEQLVDANPQPVRLNLHGAESQAYPFPGLNIDGFVQSGLILTPVDRAISSDPYYGGGTRQQNWWFAGAPADGETRVIWPQRLERMCQHATDHYNGDQNRWYGTTQGSGGGLGLVHLAFYTTKFAAIIARYPGLNLAMLEEIIGVTGWSGTTVAGTALDTEDYYDCALLAASVQRRITPLIHPFSSTDTGWHRDNVAEHTPPFQTAMNAAKRVYIGGWDVVVTASGHQIPGPPYFPESDDPGFYDRFLLNELVVAFYDASDAVAMVDGGTGQVNLYTDFGSSRHPLGGEVLFDGPNLITVPIGRIGGSATAGLCLWQIQNFSATPGQQVHWAINARCDGAGAELDSGTVTVGTLGQIEIPATLIPEVDPEDVSTGALLSVTPVPVARIPWLRA